MQLRPNELSKINKIVQRIQAGNFDENDVDTLLVKLRSYAAQNTCFLEVAHFAAHADKRDRGIAQQSITAIVDSIRYFQEYVSEKRPLNINVPFPAYLHRFFLSQTLLSDESRLKAEYGMSRTTLRSKICKAFSIDKKTKLCIASYNNIDINLISALQFIISFIYSRAACHVRDFHNELKDVMRMHNVTFNKEAWDAQADRISLAILCLMSNAKFMLDEGEAICKLETENPFRILNGQRRLPTGRMSSEPTSFGRLQVLGEATVISASKAPVRISFPLIDTDLDPHKHIDPKLFVREIAPENFGDCTVEIINLALDMSLSSEFKLVRTDSLSR